MNKIIITLALLTVLCSYSCKDDDATPDLDSGIFELRADGDLFRGNGVASYIEQTLLGRVLSIGGVENLTSTAGEVGVILLFLPEGVEPEARTYRQEIPCFGGPTNSSGCIAGSYGFIENENDEIEWGTDYDAGDVFTVSFTDVGINSGDRVRGTFFGTFSNDAGERIQITDGVFDVRVQ